MPKEDLDNYDDLIDGEPEPEEAPPDTHTSPHGEEVDGSVTLAGQEVIQEEVEPSKTEEPKPPEETEETPPEVSPFEQRFKEAGLDRQFRGGPDELLRRIPEMNKYITALESERNALRERTATREPEPVQAPSADDLYADPSGVISKIVDEKISTVNEKLAQMEVNTFIRSKQDFDEMQPLMEEQLRENPSLAQLGYGAVQVLYQMAKATQLQKVAEDAAKKASQTVTGKESAETSPGKKAVPADEDSMETFKNMTTKELEKKYGYADE